MNSAALSPGLSLMILTLLERPGGKSRLASSGDFPLTLSLSIDGRALNHYRKLGAVTVAPDKSCLPQAASTAASAARISINRRQGSAQYGASDASAHKGATTRALKQINHELGAIIAAQALH